MSVLASLLRPLPEEWKGWLDSFRRMYHPPASDAFNAQAGRKAMVAALVEATRPTCVVETGTYLGTTTRYLAETTGLPVHSVEASPRSWAIARRRLRRTNGVSLTKGDSRAFLESLSSSLSSSARPFFYLDAHWSDDLPLAEELTIIATTWSSWVVLIDDFAVPDDPGYGYDDYGPGKALTVDYLRDAGVPDSSMFVPALASEQETGARRGCVVVASSNEVRELVTHLDLLRPVPSSGEG